MAKKIYHIPLQETQRLINNHKSIFNKLTKDKSYIEYHKLIGKALYTLEIKAFLEFFKIEKDVTYSLKVMEHFNSTIFFKELYKHLNFTMFTDESRAKEFSYGFFSLFYSIDKELFKKLLQKLFLHYQSTINNPTNIEINFKDIVTTLAKLHNKTIKESFGENQEGKAFFKLFVDDILEVNLSGKSIKTLRKRGYKELFEKL